MATRIEWDQWNREITIRTIEHKLYKQYFGEYYTGEDRSSKLIYLKISIETCVGTYSLIGYNIFIKYPRPK